MNDHRCSPPEPVVANDEYTRACRARYVAVRRYWWSRRLTLAAEPLHAALGVRDG